MNELDRYVPRQYRHLMPPDEAAAYRNLDLEQKAIAYDSPSSRRFADARQSDDPEALALLRDGPETFYGRVTGRILREFAHEVFLNYCPECGALARTPQARQCPGCLHSSRG